MRITSVSLTSCCGVAVITSVLHTEGPRFKPGQQHFYICIILFGLCRRKEEKILRKKPLYQVLETRKDGVRFTNSRLRQHSMKFLELTRTYDAKQKDLENKTLDIVGL